MKRFDFIAVGGCAAGLSAAINAKRLHPELNIAVIEKNPRAGKKILATGNGKCNLTNLNALNHDYKNNRFTEYAMNAYPPEKVISFFESLGLLTYADSDGRVYPKSNTASAVLDSLRFETEKLGIEIICEIAVESITKRNGVFVINGEFEAPKILIATGGKASPSQGSDGSGYPLAKALGHRVTPLYPALVPLTVKGDLVKTAKGMRARDVRLTLENGRVLKESEGEILFTENGLSGIASMELASKAEESLKGDKLKTFTHIDFVPDMSFEDVFAHLKNVRKIKSDCNADTLLTGVLPKQIGIMICKGEKLYTNDKNISAFSDSELKRIASAVKNFVFEISGTKGYANAQVTSGGISVREINPETMESRICDGLYFAGEIIDVDGGCGGFNLQWAWASGLLVGEKI